MDILNDIVNILCANIEKVHDAYGMNKYEYLDRLVMNI